MTAKEWRSLHPDNSGNIRDFADRSQLVYLANLETLNAHFIEQGIPQRERLILLNKTARSQMKILIADTSVRRLKPQ